MKPSLNKTDDQINADLPVLTAYDAADYLADILPQLARIAKNSGLDDIGDMVAIASSFAAREKVAGHRKSD